MTPTGSTSDAEVADPSPEQAKFVKTLREFDTYRANAGSIPNYGERYRAGEVISSSMAESAVNQVISKRMVEKQQMRWSPRGAYLLLQLRTRPQRLTRRRLPPVAPRIHPRARPTGAGQSNLPQFVPLSLIATFRTRRASGPVPTVRSLTSSPTAVEPAPSRRSICHRPATTSPANASSGSETSSVVPVARLGLRDPVEEGGDVMRAAR